MDLDNEEGMEAEEDGEGKEFFRYALWSCLNFK